jgi:hypothetical protein
MYIMSFEYQIPLHVHYEWLATNGNYVFTLLILSNYQRTVSNEARLDGLARALVHNIICMRRMGV